MAKTRCLCSFQYLLRISILTSVVLLSSEWADAHNVTLYSLEELALAADEVVVGEVVSARSEPFRGTIITLYSLRVERCVSGIVDGNDELELITAGGEFNGLGALVHGSPRLVRGQRYLLFLKDRGERYSIVGQFQGARPLHENEAGNDVVAPPSDPQHPTVLTTVQGLEELVLWRAIDRVVEARYGL